MLDRSPNLSSWKCSLIYIFTVVIGYLLFPIAWGFTNGVVVAPRIASDPKFQLELEDILSKEERKTLNIENVRQLLANLHRLPDSKKYAIQTLTEKHLVGINWLPVHILVNAATFGILGFTLGLVQAHKFCLFIRLCLLPITLTVLSADQFLVVTRWLTIASGLLTEAFAVYSFSRLGKWLRTRISSSGESTRP